MRFGSLVCVYLAACGSSGPRGTLVVPHDPHPATPAPMVEFAPFKTEMILFGQRFAAQTSRPTRVPGAPLPVVYLSCVGGDEGRLTEEAKPKPPQAGQIGVAAAGNWDNCVLADPKTLADAVALPSYRWLAATFPLRDADKKTRRYTAEDLGRHELHDDRVVVAHTAIKRVIPGGTGCEHVHHPCDPGPRMPDRVELIERDAIYLGEVALEPFDERDMLGIARWLGLGAGFVPLTAVEVHGTAHERFTHPFGPDALVEAQRHAAAANDPDREVQLALELDAAVFAARLRDRAAFDVAYKRLQADVPAELPVPLAGPISESLPTLEAIASGDVELEPPAGLATYLPAPSW